jgi:hypothetical protein
MANPGERHDIEEKVELIADRIVRGKAAKNNREVSFYRLNRGATLVASTLTGAGISNPILSVLAGHEKTPSITDAFASFHWLPAWLSVTGVAIFLILLVARQFYVDEGFEKRAIQSLSLSESFSALETNFRGKLQVGEPMPQLDSIHQQALALENTFYLIIPTDSFYVQEVKIYVQDLVVTRDFCKYWLANQPTDDRR